MLCELCKREVVFTTKHHLIPRTRHKNKRVKRYTTGEQRSQTVNLCQPCSCQIHTIFSEKELADSYNTLDALMKHPDVSRFLVWLKKKPSHFHIKARA